MKPIRPLAAWLCLLMPLSLVAQEKAASAGERPNVLFIVCDDLNTHVSTSGYNHISCLLYTSPSPRDLSTSRMPSSA